MTPVHAWLAPVFAAALAATAALGSSSALAQAYPAKPVRLIVGFTAGGASDIMGRAIAARLTEQMALEWGPLGLRVNAVAPGFIDAGISAPFFANPAVRELRSRAVPMRRLGTAADVAEAVMFLASDEASYVNGHELVVDGGVVSSLLLQLPREPART